MTELGGSNLGFSSGLFDFGPAHAAQATSNVKDVEICRLREELGAARAKLHSWEESMGRARTACDAWKKEAAIAQPAPRRSQDPRLDPRTTVCWRTTGASSLETQTHSSRTSTSGR